MGRLLGDISAACARVLEGVKLAGPDSASGGPCTPACRWVLSAWVLLIVGLSLYKYAGRLQRAPDGLDESSILRQVAPLTPLQVAKHFVKPEVQWDYYRPLGILSLYLDRVVWDRPHVTRRADGNVDWSDFERQLDLPETAFPYRLTDTIIHILTSIAFGFMMGQVARSRPVGLVAGLIYAGAPINATVVTWYPARFSGLCAPFLFLSVLFFFRQFDGERRRLCLALSLGSLVLALGCKENPIVMPVLLGSWTAFLLPKQRWREALIPLAAICGIVAVYLLVRYHAVGFLMPEEVAAAAGNVRFRTLPARFMIGPAFDTFHTLLWFPGGAWMLLTPSFWGGVFSFAVFWSTGYLLVRREIRLTLSLCVWMAVLYVPIAHIYAFNMFSHYLYLPSAGVIGLVSLGIYNWWVVSRSMTAYLRVPIIVAMAWCIWSFYGL